ncbi:hypothetical protein GJW-30_1_03871 [Variibacter gotjawalensis]|uniref:DUF1028 domain-containing protein n=1 Tax=Variibacter gotjawalensis TaxID=1333996 RepID=A0A0S3PZH1_9BRAD|nr:DUF1028 domain-containing protein [Variibacter gotjawalensis]NIK47152.1 putative Ntn-hydrolase superfamily protein [Variibacter gotjawalensis]RZS49052.1 putative Ntn-hydrolase superfamily protein [Variibacter gotjawalensis]BAT61314.1 hypothetical protein GJW-30_1_03871 [Variibacter gotjawalensis]
MTWLIVARDIESGLFGIAVSTCAFAVGGWVPHAAGDAGAVATQSYTNPLYGVHGLAMMRAGESAENTLRALTAADDNRDYRQVHAMDRVGTFAAYTGASCVAWCGHLIREHFSVAGNMLVGPQVIEETASVYEAQAALPFPRRLLAALLAGEVAGGDKRGKQSAALLIQDGEEYTALSLRVDDHADPIAELNRLEAKSRERYVHYRKCMPTRAQPSGLRAGEEMERAIAKSIAAQS